MSARAILIDCDPGVDDAIMLIMALSSPALDVRAITTLAGNVPLRLTSRNARMLCELLDRREVPVYAGADRPLARTPVTAEEFHGESGIAGIEPFEPAKPLASGHAVNAILEALAEAPEGGLTLVATGPLTNVALALLDDPGAFSNLRELVVMAGADTEGGNITPHAEFNVFADPHAAGLVFDAGLPTTVLSLDVTHTLRATPDRMQRFATLGTDKARMCHALMEASGRFEVQNGKAPHAPMHDPSTIGWLLKPELFSSRQTTVTVDAAEGDTFGKTLLSAAPGPHRWITSADADGFFALLEALT